MRYDIILGHIKTAFDRIVYTLFKKKQYKKLSETNIFSAWVNTILSGCSWYRRIVPSNGYNLKCAVFGYVYTRLNKYGGIFVSNSDKSIFKIWVKTDQDCFTYLLNVVSNDAIHQLMTTNIIVKTIWENDMETDIYRTCLMLFYSFTKLFRPAHFIQSSIWIQITKW